jgi:WD40 repeat protein
MIPDHRLAVLLDHVKQNQINQCLYHNTGNPPSLYCDHLCDRNAFPRYPSIQLTQHTNEIWYVEFSHDGTKLATASKDHHVIVWDVTNDFTVIHNFWEHDEPVAYATWSPDDTKLITCSQDKKAKVWDIAVSHRTRRCVIIRLTFVRPGIVS